MCLSGSVGRGGANARDDVRTVQLLLNMNAPQTAGPTIPDGHCGGDTVAAIELYQRNVIGCTDRAGLVTAPAAAAENTAADTSAAAHGSTLAALRAGLPPGLSEGKLEGILIHAPAATVARFYPALLAALQTGAMDTPRRQAHFLAQVAHESGELRYTEEIATGAAYEGRKDLGNTRPGDGPRYKGRGLIQLTGRANYAAYGKARGADFLKTPERISAEPALAADVAVWFWQRHSLNAAADRNDIVAITRAINGGQNGLANRKALLARALWFLEPSTPADPTTAGIVRDLRAIGEEVLW